MTVRIKEGVELEALRKYGFKTGKSGQTQAGLLEVVE